MCDCFRIAWGSSAGESGFRAGQDAHNVRELIEASGSVQSLEAS